MTARESLDASEPTGRRGVVAVAWREGRFLTIRRGSTVRAPGKICFPGGHVEAGETEAEAVVRECREELQAHVEALECLWRSVTPWGTALEWWRVEVPADAELVPHPVEVAAIHWLSFEELLAEPDLLDGNREFLRHAVAAGHFGL